ncbi:MAG: cupredoxin domain-containing protein [Acidimicrobiia bacterium]
MTVRLRRLAAVVAPLVAGLVLVACGGGGSGDSAYVQPKGPAKETISLSAKNFSFTPDKITTKAGIAKIELTGEGGLHTLVFDHAFPGFQLEVEGNTTSSKKVDLKPGKYTFYCDVTGHRQAGMEGTITVK